MCLFFILYIVLVEKTRFKSWREKKAYNGYLLWYGIIFVFVINTRFYLILNLLSVMVQICTTFSFRKIFSNLKKSKKLLPKKKG